MDALKTSLKDVRRVMPLTCLQDVNFEFLVHIYFRCNIFNFVSPNVCLIHERVSCFIVLRFLGETFQRRLIVTS